MNKIMVGKKAPNFTTSAVINGKEIINNFTLNEFLGKNYILLIFYPKDFTFVCPTELHAFQNEIEEFESRNVQLIAISTDTEQSHLGWLQVPKNQGGIKGITYPLVSDINKTISYDYGVLVGNINFKKNILKVEGELIAYRALFLIDKKSIIRHQLINDLPLGRSISESIRIIDALQHFEKNGEVCPANWIKGKKAIKTNHKSISKYLSNN
jgi:peroxiredoxin (alkyl hydroperoxide reductase subunit C)